MSAQTPIIVHHLNDSRSQRVLWLLEELEVPYEVKFYQRTADYLAPPELRAVHPLGRSPVITDGPVTLAETAAIVEYLIKKYGKGKFVAPEEGELTELYFRNFSEGTFLPILGQQFVFEQVPKKAPFLLRPLLKVVFTGLTKLLVAKPLQGSLDYIETTLSKSNSTWFAGGPEPTASDFLLSYGIETLAVEKDSPLGPKAKAWLAAVQARPAYKRGLKKGGDYAYAKN
ncbi:thioredoxin-like protein [Auriscalpium vulgare]|uniref:Thioredoxin-like protein n=1 Tax=Auriscalpium vulgare TaxID=40419 RepID=A0ACB8S5D4_9AGAM|nr:thioredoxin-like protein [Auriscalpium vulgare]